MYTYNATVERVVDGDTIDLIVDLGFHIFHAHRFRLHGINAPEIRTRDLDEKERGMIAFERLEELCPIGSQVKVVSVGTGKFGRYIGIIYPHGSEKSANKILIEEELAQKYKD